MDKNIMNKYIVIKNIMDKNIKYIMNKYIMNKYIVNKYIMILGGVLVVALIAVGVFYTINRGGISKTQVSQKVIDFVNEQLLQGKATASLVNITLENGLYKIKFNIGEQEIESYATTDGKFFFPDSFNLEKNLPTGTPGN